MLCENCKKKEASMHIKTVTNGVKNEIHLCEDCAMEKGYIGFKVNPLNQMLNSILDDGAFVPQAETKRCKCCGTTLYEIRRTGKVGCAECYETFIDELLPYIRRIHSSTVHIGKKPTENRQIRKTDTVEELKSELQRMIKEENYEQAAVIRDKIRQAEGKTV